MYFFRLVLYNGRKSCRYGLQRFQFIIDEVFLLAKRYYELHVAGCTRQLPILNVTDKLAIAGFVILGDTEIVENTAKEMVKKIPADTEVLMTAETKGIPLAAEMARILGMKRYVIARKSVKAYMENPLIVEDESITTQGKQMLCLMDTDIALIRNKKTFLLDDVISTGGSMRALAELAEKAGAEIIGKAAILAEGDAAMRQDIIYLEKLPLFDAE
ncbi:phosphoribosyl transferase domain protein [Megasphaera vaginalis (ex Srinivasan et al. 2021)]|uniref:Phosphoribosyl transferase domain protein n=1 Tax=Megasphaera vaginalis (ex Srinivasan et al. 2021) TaxID=1111454 RepID=U7UBA8_9FIRM|nr:phosphoribosyl transferase domain protein [Megasphaera vaginalis (ex Srinivasan et al. 2021)]